MTAGEFLEYEEEILDLIQREKLSSRGEQGFDVYLEDDIGQKMYSINSSVEE
ncbi:hypothetical protein CLK_2788 [Clostridium botulinum A3 str. Loch Maree]|nr:hypothetical protein CLK_2788 [Clostridium botulinum A3 str. Loch Maree]